VSNQPGVAPNTDPNLVNAWGLVALGPSPWWVSDNGTGDSSLYNATGQPVIASGGTTNFVTVPPAPSSPAGSLGTPTGIVGHQLHRDRLYSHGRRQIGPIDFYLRHIRRYVFTVSPTYRYPSWNRRIGRKNGEFTIPDVPPGRSFFHVWSEN
jgi:hypothetical protein